MADNRVTFSEVILLLTVESHKAPRVTGMEPSIKESVVTHARTKIFTIFKAFNAIKLRGLSCQVDRGGNRNFYDFVMMV